MFVNFFLNKPYFVAKFTNTACEAEMIEKLCPEANIFLCQPGETYISQTIDIDVIQPTCIYQ